MSQSTEPVALWRPIGSPVLTTPLALCDLRPEEAPLLKIYDSRRDVAQAGAHSAFDDPNTPPGAPARRSIELRALVFREA